MPRKTNFGLSEDQISKIIHRDRQTTTVWKNTAYDIRKWHEDVIEDLIWLYSSYTPQGQRTRFSFYPIDTIIPSDPKKIRETVRWIEGAIANLERLKDMIGEYGIQSMKRGRY